MELDMVKFIQPELLILVAVIYGLGMFFKQVPNFPDWAIPLTLLAISISLTIVYMAIVLEGEFCSRTIVNGVVYGVLIATIAVFTNQIIKQIKIGQEK